MQSIPLRNYIFFIVEIPRDVVGTVKYSVRAAQIAVFGMMGVDKKKDICKVEHNFKALAHAVKKLLT
jgi:oleate hydratase